MDTLRFLSPDGSLVNSPRLMDILKLIREEGEAFWNSDEDTGFALLTYHRNGEEVARLVFTKKDGYGFHMTFTEHFGQRGKECEYISVGGHSYDDIAEVNLAGSPILLPRAFFIGEDEAEQVVRDFFQGGKRQREPIWTPASDLNWDVRQGRQV